MKKKNEYANNSKLNASEKELDVMVTKHLVL